MKYSHANCCVPIRNWLLHAATLRLNTSLPGTVLESAGVMELVQTSETIGSIHRFVNRPEAASTVMDRLVSGTVDMTVTGTRPLSPVRNTNRPKPGTTHSLTVTVNIVASIRFRLPVSVTQTVMG